MTNVLLVLAVIGMLVGIYAVAMPTLTRKGWRLPFAGFFSDADDGEDEAFATPFEMPRVSDIPAVIVPALEPVEEAQPLPPVLAPRGLDEEEDDPTLTPLFEGLDDETAPTAISETQAPTAAEPQKPRLVVTEAQPAAQAPTPDGPEVPVKQPEPEAAPAGDDMLSLFSEAADAGRGPNRVREAAGDVTLSDLMDEVRKLREILDNNQLAA